MNPSKILPLDMVTTLLTLRSEAQEEVAGKLPPKPQVTGIAVSPPDSQPIPVGVDHINPAPHPYPSEFAKPPVEFRLWENGGAPHYLLQVETGNHGAFDTRKPDAEVYHWRTLFLDWLGKVIPENTK